MARTDTSALEAAQRLLWKLIVAPEGVSAALADPGEEGVSPRQLKAIVRSDAMLSAEHRLGVYANAYFQRILHCMENDFPALASATSQAGFNDLVTSYLAVAPPEHFSLRYAGARLAMFLSDHPAGAPFRGRWPWCADLARLEWAIRDDFDAADSATTGRADLAQLAPERWAELELALTPAVRQVDTQWRVARVRRLYEQERLDSTATVEVEAGRVSICVWRAAERVFHRELDPLEAAALERVAEGALFGDLCDLAALQLGTERAASKAATWLSRWLDDGLLAIR